MADQNDLFTIERLQAENARLIVEKEDMRQRNELLRKRLDMDAEKIKPRLTILDRVDALEAENARLREEVAATRTLLDACCDAPLKLDIAKQNLASRDALIEELAAALGACIDAGKSSSGICMQQVFKSLETASRVLAKVPTKGA